MRDDRLARADRAIRESQLSGLAAECGTGWLGSIAASANANAKPRVTFPVQ